MQQYADFSTKRFTDFLTLLRKITDDVITNVSLNIRISAARVIAKAVFC
jgi:hypothetical protein